MGNCITICNYSLWRPKSYLIHMENDSMMFLGYNRKQVQLKVYGQSPILLHEKVSMILTRLRGLSASPRDHRNEQQLRESRYPLWRLRSHLIHTAGLPKVLSDVHYFGIWVTASQVIRSSFSQMSLLILSSCISLTCCVWIQQDWRVSIHSIVQSAKQLTSPSQDRTFGVVWLSFR